MSAPTSDVMRTPPELVARLDQLGGAEAVATAWLMYGHGRTDELLLQRDTTLAPLLAAAAEIAGRTGRGPDFAEVLDAVGAISDARRLREAVDSSRRDWLASARLVRTSESFVVLSGRRHPTGDPSAVTARTAAERQAERIWAGWPGGGAT